MSDTEMVTFTCRLPAALVKNLDQLAKGEDRSRNSMMKRLLESGLTAARRGELGSERPKAKPDANLKGERKPDLQKALRDAMALPAGEGRTRAIQAAQRALGEER